MAESERVEGVPARHWHALKDGRIQCDVCPRYCKLHDEAAQSTYCPGCGRRVIGREW